MSDESLALLGTLVVSSEFASQILGTEFTSQILGIFEVSLRSFSMPSYLPQMLATNLQGTEGLLKVITLSGADND